MRFSEVYQTKVSIPEVRGREERTVPSDDLHEVWFQLEDLLPAWLPEPIGIEQPVFVVTIWRVVGEEEG